MLYGRQFPRYKSVLKIKCTEWPQIDFGILEVKHTCDTAFTSLKLYRSLPPETLLIGPQPPNNDHLSLRSKFSFSSVYGRRLLRYKPCNFEQEKPRWDSGKSQQRKKCARPQKCNAGYIEIPSSLVV